MRPKNNVYSLLEAPLYHEARGLSLVSKAGLSKCGAQLEALLRGPTYWRVQKFLRSIKS